MWKASSGAVARLSDSALLRQVTALCGAEREATAELVGHLAELDARKLYLREGYGSLFAYCTQALRLAEHAAYNRIEAARLSRRFPSILELLASGELNLSTLRVLGPQLEPDSFAVLVEKARCRSKREVEEIVARHAPRPDAPASVRKLPTRPGDGECPPRVPSRSEAEAEATTYGNREGLPRAPAPVCTGSPRSPVQGHAVSPLAPERYRVQFTMAGSTHRKLRQLQDLLRREIPSGDLAVLFDRAVTLLLEDTKRRKLAATSRPQLARRSSPGSRHITAAVKREVWLRDGGRCAFVSGSGRRCTATAFLELHHLEPYAIGGDSTAGNISLRCRAHNVYESESLFGPATIGEALA